VRGALLSGAPALVIDLGGGNMAMAEQFLDLADVDAGVEQQCRGGGAERVGAENAGAIFDGVGQLRQVIGTDTY
jgi:hypothetical protein